MEKILKQSELEDLSAYVDGELDAARAAEIARLIETDALWRQAHLDLLDLNAALDAYVAPSPSSDLAARIVRNIRQQEQRPLASRILRWAAPLTAAATILIAVGVWRNMRTAPVSVAPDQAGIRTEDAETLAKENLDFFQDIDIAVNMETLDEIDRLDGAENESEGV